MCIAIPGRVLELEQNRVLVDFSGARKSVKTDILKPEKGDWVLVFSGQVMEVVSEERAREILDTVFRGQNNG